MRVAALKAVEENHEVQIEDSALWAVLSQAAPLEAEIEDELPADLRGSEA